MRSFTGWQKLILGNDILLSISNSFLEIATGDELKKISSLLLEKVTEVGEINANSCLMYT